MRYQWQPEAVRIAVTMVLVGVGAALAVAGALPPALPGVPDIGPPTAAPLAPAVAPSAPAPTATAGPPAAPSGPAPVAAPGAAPAAPAGPPLSAEEHYARGEVQFAGTWVPIDNLFKDYRAARAELQGIEAKTATARDGIATLQSQVTAMKNESAQAEQPIRKDVAKQTGKRREMTKASEARAPAQPRLQPLPQRPRQYAATMHSQYSSSSSNQYDQAMQDYQMQLDAVTRANDMLTKKYQADYAQWKKAKDDADKELPKIEQALKDLQAKLDQNTAALTTRQAPVMEKLKAANDEAQGIGRKVDVLQARIKAMADAILAAPETVRFKHGILEWEGVLAPLADLEKQLNQTQADIDRVTQQMKAEGKAPEGWRHPQQDRMDALGRLVARAKAAAK